MGTIAVFVNDTPESQAAIEFGAREAAIRGARLRLIAAWEVPQSMLGSGVAQREVFDEFRENAESLLQEAEERVLELEPAVEVELSAVKGQPAAVFLEASLGADLIVAVRKPQGGLRELVMGSISKYILNHAQVPVVVIPVLPPEK